MNAQAMDRWRPVLAVLWVAAAAWVAGLAGVAAAAEAEGDPSVLEAPTHMTATHQEESWPQEIDQDPGPITLNHYAPPSTEVGGDQLFQAPDPEAVPGLAPGWSPESGLPQPGPYDEVELRQEMIDALMQRSFDNVPVTTPPFLPPSNPTDYNNYAPYNRYAYYARYLNQPTSHLGRLEILWPDGSHRGWCSASLIGRNTIATASHCLHQGGGGSWYGNWRFCPSWNAGGVNPNTGCWGWTAAKVSVAWVTTPGGDPDRDYACLVLQPTNPTTGKAAGDVAGWSGRAWNWPTKQSIFSWGYPSAPPFNGNNIMVSASTEWYEVDRTSGGQKSKYIGSDQTPGCSGGPWWFGIAHYDLSKEIPDVDGSSITDPPGHNSTAPFINGVNSHRRCSLLGCPSGSVYLSEMGSPPFRNTTDDTDESEDVFAWCFNNGGS